MNTERYIRQTSLKDFGVAGQQALSKSSVLVVGVGGLGIPVLQYLNAMGVGTLGMVEQDLIELSNLQRQVLFSEEDLGKQKLQVAYDKLRAMNSGTILKTHDSFLTRDNALEIIASYDVVVDASDNFATRYLVNDACVILKKPFVYGALHGFEGHLSVFNYKGGPTYRCLFPEPPNNTSIPDCNENGVLGVIPGIVGSLQALEVVKILANIGEVMYGKLLIYNGLNQSFHKINFPVIPQNLKRSSLEKSYEIPSCTSLKQISAASFKKVMKGTDSWQLIDVRNTEEFNQDPDPIPQATNIPLSELETHTDQIKPNHILYFVCQTGIRSLTAISLLGSQFPENEMYSIIGGMDHWRTTLQKASKSLD